MHGGLISWISVLTFLRMKPAQTKCMKQTRAVRSACFHLQPPVSPSSFCFSRACSLVANYAYTIIICAVSV
uniref:Putative secreted protein n=1 Tax=Rhipicephalus microplus TaxID=6941 RepID=A0A6G5A2J1_RHIMP